MCHQEMISTEHNLYEANFQGLKIFFHMNVDFQGGFLLLRKAFEAYNCHSSNRYNLSAL